MPFTPFHLGPAILIGLLLRDYIDLPTFVAANLIVDIRATLIFFGFMEGTLHGFLHTFLFGSLLGLGLAALAYRLRSYTGQVMKFFRLEQLESWRSFLAAGVLGVWIHVFLDSFLYNDIRPFMPLEINPFSGLITSPNIVIYGFCLISLFLGSAYYLYLLWLGSEI